MTARILIMLFSIVIALTGSVMAEENEATAESTATEAKATAKDSEGLPYCPICGPEDEHHGISLGYRYKGKKYKFCSMGCLKAFKADPDRYLSEDYDSDGHQEDDQEN